MKKLDDFVFGYIRAALWLSSDEYGEPLDRDFTIDNFSDEAIAQAIEDCERFQDENADDLYDVGNEAQNGHDFWLTRNGHGAGFRDRDYGAVGERLSLAARAFGEANLYVGDDGLLYLG